MNSKNLRRLVLVLFAGLGVTAIYGCYLAAFTDVTYYAHYPLMVLSSSNNSQWWDLRTGDRIAGKEIAPLYIDLDGKVRHLPDLTEQNLREYRKDEKPIQVGGTVYIIGQNHYTFRKGKLVEAKLDSYGPKISMKPDGPFHSVLMSREEAVNMFGEPDRIEKRRTKRNWVFR